MAKVQPKKKAASGKKSAASKPAARPKPAPKKAAPARKAAAPKSKAKKPPKPAARVAKAAPAKRAAKPVAKPAPKAKAQPKKAAAKPAKVAKRTEQKPAPSTRAASVAKSAARIVAQGAVSAIATPVVQKAAQAIASKVEEKKRTRRSRTRVTSNGPASAAWFTQGDAKPRPSSFIPAPPRAEAPSLVAAPPASSDRLIRPEDLNHLAVRTVPVRVDVEQSGGRAFISVNPQEATLRAGEGIEWDFRYIGGADVLVEEVIVEFERPSPFGAASFKSQKPGTARPHRQLSGAASVASAGKRLQYTIRAMTAFKTELASTRPWLTVLA